MPWVLEETFAAGGLDLHARGRRCAGSTRCTGSAGPARTRTSTSPTTPRGCARRWRSSPAATPRAWSRSSRRWSRSTSEGILGAGRRAVPLRARLRAARADAWCGWTRCGRCTRSSPASSSTRACARRSPSTRCSSAATRTACRPSTARSCYLQVARRRLVRRRRRLRGGARRWRGRSTSAAASASERIEHARRPRHRRAARGRRADRRRRRRLQRRRAAHARARRPPRRRAAGCARRCRASCSTWARTGRSRRCCTTRCWWATATASSSAPSRAARELPRTLLHLRPRAGAHGAARWRAAGGDSLAVLLPVPEPARRASTGTRDGDRLRDALLADLETTFGLDGLRDAIVGRAPHDAAGLRARARRGVGQRVRRSSRRCTSPPTSARPTATARLARPLLRGRRHASGRGRARACCSGAEVTAGLVAADHGPARRPRAVTARRCAGARRWSPRRATTTQRVAAHVLARLPAAAARRARRRLPALPRLPHARRPRRRGGEPDAAERVAAVEAWARGRAARRTREVDVLDDLARAPPAPARGAGRLLRGHALGPRGAAVRTEAELDAYCYRVAGTVGHRHGRGAGHDATTPARGPPPPRSAWRCSGRTSCATSTRTAPPAAPTSRARSTDRFGGRRCPGAREALLRDQIAKADARYDEGIAGIALLRRGRAAVARGGVDVPRDPAPDRARRLRRAARPGGRAPRRRKLVGRRARRSAADVARRDDAGRQRAPTGARGTVRAVERPARRRPPAALHVRRRVVVGLVAARAAAAAAARSTAARRAPRPPRRAAAAAARRRPSCPAAGGSCCPSHRVVAYYGAPQADELGALGIGTPDRGRRGGCSRQARAYERPRRPVLPAHGAASRRSPTPTPGEDGMYRTRAARRRHPPLPARRARRHGMLLRARHPARPLGLLHGDRCACGAGCASPTSASRSTRSGA